MDTELVIGIAQILTAIATLIVAVFLAGQLVIPVSYTHLTLPTKA